MWKRILIIIGVLAVILYLITNFIKHSTDGIERSIENDYMNNFSGFSSVVMNNSESRTISCEDYDKNSAELCVIFEELGYQFIRITDKGVFFCKTYHGMSGYGLFYDRYGSYEPTIKEKKLKALDENWVIFSEHYL